MGSWDACMELRQGEAADATGGCWAEATAGWDRDTNLPAAAPAPALNTPKPAAGTGIWHPNILKPLVFLQEILNYKS